MNCAGQDDDYWQEHDQADCSCGELCGFSCPWYGPMNETTTVVAVLPAHRTLPDPWAAAKTLRINKMCCAELTNDPTHKDWIRT